MPLLALHLLESSIAHGRCGLKNFQLEVKVFNPLAPTHCSIPQCYRHTELEKKRKYEEGIREVEYGIFSLLVFSCTGDMGPLATVVC